MQRNRRALTLAWAWAVISTILAFTLGYRSYRQTRQTLTENFSTQQLLLATQAATGIEGTIERLRSRLALVAGRGYGGPEEALLRFRDFVTEEQGAIAAFFWLDPEGKVAFGLAPGGEAKLATELAEIRADQTLARFLRQGPASPAPASHVGVSGPACLHLAARLDSPHPEPRGSLVACVDVEPLIRRFAGMLQPTGKGYAWSLSPAGEILYHDALPELVGRDAREESRQPGNDGLTAIVGRMLRREAGTGEYRFRGVRKYAAFAPIGLPADFLSLALCSPIEELTSVTRIGFTTTLVLVLQLVSSFTLVLYLTFAGRRAAVERSRDFAALWSVSSLRTRKTSLEEFLRACLAEIHSANDTRAAWIYLADPETDRLELKASICETGSAVPPPAAEVIAQAHGEGAAFPPGHPAFVILAIPGREKPLGVLVLLFRGEPEHSLSKKEILHLLAAEVGSSLESLIMVEELQSASIQLARANEMQSSFIGMVSHELKTPIAVIKGYLSLLRDRAIPAGSPEMDTILETMSRKAKHLERMVNDLLDLTRMQAGTIPLDLATLEVRAFLKESLHGLEPAVRERGLTLALRVEDGLPPLLADRGRLGQVIGNLVTNALKFTAAGGTIEVTAGATEAGVEFRVRDSGVGIPAADQERIFNRFYQVGGPGQKQHAGVGLGLTIVRQIVELHGGRIRCESRLGEGSTFIFTIPPASSAPRS